jgi:hypothetical protein
LYVGALEGVCLLGTLWGVCGGCPFLASASTGFVIVVVGVSTGGGDVWSRDSVVGLLNSDEMDIAPSLL